jgi:type VI secretion system protein ImpA
MGAIEVGQFLAAVAPDNPCGVDLGSDLAFYELENAARGKLTRSENGSEKDLEEPDWPVVRRLAEALMPRTKDLRIILHMTRALTRTEGYSGLVSGLEVLRGWIESYWDGIHPRLDPADGNDPTERINILLGFADPLNLVQFVRQSTLVESREFGRISLRDYDIASGKQTPPIGTAPANMATIDACFRAAELIPLQKTQCAISECIDHVAALTKVLVEKLTSERAPDFTPLLNNLMRAKKVLDEVLVSKGAPVEKTTSLETDRPPTLTSQAAKTGEFGPLSSRDDCVKVLDLVADYFKRREPSSPIPLLIERAKRLMAKDFMEIMQDLAPDGVAQANKIFGTEKKV